MGEVVVVVVDAVGFMSGAEDAPVLKPEFFMTDASVSGGGLAIAVARLRQETNRISCNSCGICMSDFIVFSRVKEGVPGRAALGLLPHSSYLQNIIARCESREKAPADAEAF
jgi:hypothetical protein